MGFEPFADFVVTANSSCSCEFCEGYRAANALHSGCSKWLDSALNDANLQRLIAAWNNLPEGLQTAIMALVGTTFRRPQDLSDQIRIPPAGTGLTCKKK